MTTYLDNLKSELVRVMQEIVAHEEAEPINDKSRAWDEWYEIAWDMDKKRDELLKKINLAEAVFNPNRNG